MKKICPICGKKSKISVNISKETYYSVYKLISKYKCKNCGGHLIRNKNEPSIKDNIVISIITLASGLLFYFLLYDGIITTIFFMSYIFVSAYYDLGFIDAYFPKKLLPADERDILYIPKPNATVTFESQIYKKIKRYDILTTMDETISLFCVKLDYENNTAECHFLSDRSDCCSKPIDLYINGKFKISCVITYI